MAISREDLHQQVWAEPMTAVAKRHGVSSNYLARICERLRVPHPPRGYWAKLKVGTADPKPALPAVLPGDELEWSRDGHAHRSPPALPQAPPQGRRRRRRNTPCPDRHPLVAGAREHFDKVRPARYSDAGYLRPFKRALVDVFVTRDALERALDTASELFLSLEDRGHRVALAAGYRPDLDPREIRKPAYSSLLHYAWRPGIPTIVHVGTVAIGLALYEISENVEVRRVGDKYVRVSALPAMKRRSSYGWTHREDLASGRLGLRAASAYQEAQWEKEWREEVAGDLPKKFRQIARELEAAAPTIASLVAEGREQSRREYEAWEASRLRYMQAEAERRRVEAHRESRAQLLSIVEAWALARRIERFFDDLSRRAHALGDEGQQVAINERLEQARRLLGGTDALARFQEWLTPAERLDDT
jgi:hypothetical protein